MNQSLRQQCREILMSTAVALSVIGANYCEDDPELEEMLKKQVGLMSTSVVRLDGKDLDDVGAWKAFIEEVVVRGKGKLKGHVIHEQGAES
jgi:hypothetical protein